MLTFTRHKVKFKKGERTKKFSKMTQKVGCALMTFLYRIYLKWWKKTNTAPWKKNFSEKDRPRGTGRHCRTNYERKQIWHHPKRRRLVDRQKNEKKTSPSSEKTKEWIPPNTEIEQKKNLTKIKPVKFLWVLGQRSPSQGKMPARRTCFTYHKNRHYQAVRRSVLHHSCSLRQKPIYELEEEELFLGHIFHVDDNNCWRETILTNESPHIFELDTGASALVVSENGQKATNYANRRNS